MDLTNLGMFYSFPLCTFIFMDGFTQSQYTDGLVDMARWDSMDYISDGCPGWFFSFMGLSAHGFFALFSIHITLNTSLSNMSQR